jgi:hypothetical protein
LQFNFFIFVLFLNNLFVIFEIHNLRLLFPTLVHFKFTFFRVLDPLSNILLSILMLISPLTMLLIVHPFAHIDIPILIVILALTIHQSIDPRTLLPRASGPFVLADASLQTLVEISKVTLLVGSQPSAVAMEAAIDEPALEKLSATLFFTLKIVHDTHALGYIELRVTTKN